MNHLTTKKTKIVYIIIEIKFKGKLYVINLLKKKDKKAPAKAAIIINALCFISFSLAILF